MLDQKSPTTNSLQATSMHFLLASCLSNSLFSLLEERIQPSKTSSLFEGSCIVLLSAFEGVFLYNHSHLPFQNPSLSNHASNYYSLSATASAVHKFQLGIHRILEGLSF
ncbi:MAG: hypothetical protein EB051_04845, partial [Chlamydiia bacterium]|nr:hypothetical protein [Chlamydiia bacterium]